MQELEHVKNAGPSSTPPGQCIAYVAGNMYLGTRHVRNPAFLKTLKITHVLTFSSTGSFLHTMSVIRDADTFVPAAAKAGIKLLTVKVNDAEGEHLLPLYEKEEVKAFLQEGTSGDNKCVVQCGEARSRSVSMIALHLIGNQGLSVLEALLMLLSARFTLEPCFSFIEDMKKLEKQMGKKESFKGTNLPGIRENIFTISESHVVEKNREFFKKHINLVKQLREKEPEPQETALPLYKKVRFDDFEPIEA